MQESCCSIVLPSARTLCMLCQRQFFVSLCLLSGTENHFVCLDSDANCGAIDHVAISTFPVCHAILHSCLLFSTGDARSPMIWHLVCLVCSGVSSRWTTSTNAFQSRLHHLCEHHQPQRCLTLQSHMIQQLNIALCEFSALLGNLH